MPKQKTNKHLHEAKKKKNDEFYTRYVDIEKELSHYKDQLQGKWVYSPCDDYRWSQFPKYFIDNFQDLGLSHYTCTKTYDPEKYPKYDNYDAINVDKVKDIPWDYDGVIGCPITILDHNLDNVEIADLSRFLQDTRGMSKEFVDEYYRQGNTGQICEGHPDLCFYDKGKAVVPYMRVLIKKNFEIEGIWNDKREEADFIVKGTPTYVDEKHKSFQGPVVDGKAKYARVLIRTKHAFIPKVENNPQE